jgi:imidazole glycerol phosphate synthase subunit HisF
MTSILFQNKTLTDKPVLNIEIDIHEITDIIIVLDPKKATEADDISHRLLKFVADEIAIPLLLSN